MPSLPDDWPDFDLLTALSKAPAKLRAWVALSSRRSLSPDGTRLVVARRRRGGAIGAYVTNMPPETPTAGIESLDFVRVGVSSRVILPLGVSVSKVHAHDDGMITLSLTFDVPVQQALGVGVALEVTVASTALAQLPEPWPARQGAKMLDAFAALIASGMSGAPAALAARADAYVASVRAADEDRERRLAESKTRARRDAERRSSRVPLGPAESALVTTAQQLGWTGEALEAVLVFARPTLALLEAADVSTAEIGRTRIGGAPDLAPGVAWPAVDGELLSFVLQLALDDLPALGRPRLPRHGLLSLFFGHNDSTRDVEHVLLHTPSSLPTNLVRAEPPEGAVYRDDETGLLDAVAVRVVPAIRLPPYGTSAFDALAEAWPGAAGEQAVFALDKALRVAGSRDQTFIGGYVEREVSAHAMRHARRRGDPPAHHRWELLLDVASHLSVALNFWDAGRLAVVLPREDLEATEPRWDRSYAEIATS